MFCYSTPGYQDLPGDPTRNSPGAAQFYAAFAQWCHNDNAGLSCIFSRRECAGLSARGDRGRPYGSVHRSRYPAEFQNDLFFTDVNDGEVFVVDVNYRSDVKFLYKSRTAPIAFSQGPDGYMYVANLYEIL